MFWFLTLLPPKTSHLETSSPSSTHGRQLLAAVFAYGTVMAPSSASSSDDSSQAANACDMTDLVGSATGAGELS